MVMYQIVGNERVLRLDQETFYLYRTDFPPALFEMEREAKQALEEYLRCHPANGVRLRVVEVTSYETPKKFYLKHRGNYVSDHSEETITITTVRGDCLIVAGYPRRTPFFFELEEV